MVNGLPRVMALSNGWSRALPFGAFLVAIILTSCGPKEREDVIPRPENLPDQVIEGLVLRETENGALRWTLWADRALKFENKPTQLEGVRIVFYDEKDHTEKSVLTSLGGTVDEKTRDLLAEGDVVVVTADSIRLETPELRWDRLSGKIHTETPVKITEGQSVLTGIGITSDIDLNSYVIHKDVKGTLRDKDGSLEREFN